jgi:hypothetical protein
MPLAEHGREAREDGTLVRKIDKLEIMLPQSTG